MKQDLNLSSHKSIWAIAAKWLLGIIAVLGFGITIYLGFFKKKEPKLEYDIVSSTTFINNNETSAHLKIFIDSLDVQKNHLNITAYNIKVENKGSEHIRYDDYDKGDFGIRIEQGILLEPPTILESSTEHISDLFPKNDSLYNETFLEIPHLSLDIDDYYVLHVVLLHSVDSIPCFYPEGKIIGQKDIVFQPQQASTPGFWSEIFHGEWHIHIIRFILAVIILFLIVSICFSISSMLNNIYMKRERKKFVKSMKSRIKNITQFVKDDYIKYGESFIEEVHDIYNKKEIEITNQYNKSTKVETIQEETKNREYSLSKGQLKQIDNLIDKGYFTLHMDGSISFKKEAKRSVQNLYSILEEEGKIIPRVVRVSV